MRNLFVTFFLVPLIISAQRFYNTDDYFSISNPSAFVEKKIYATGVFNVYNPFSLNNNYTYALYKQNINRTGFSVGFNGDFQNFGILKSTRGAMQLAYKLKLTRKLSLNSGVGINASKDNFKYYGSVYPIKFSNWNPTYIGIDVGLTLLSKKWIVGFSVINLNQGKRIIDTTQTKTNAYLTFLGSYDFKLDSLGKFHLVPSLFIEYSPNGFVSSYFNLKFNFSKYSAFYQRHSIGFGYGASNSALFYEYRFGNGLSLGASLGKDRSKLSNQFSDTWNALFRLNFEINGRRGCVF